MPTENIHKNRLKLLRRALKEHKVDAYLTMNPENIFYLSGFSGSSGLFVVGRDSSTLLTDSRYSLQSKREVTHSKIIIYKRSSDALDTICKMKETAIGYNAQKITHKMYLQLKKLLKGKKLIDLSGTVENLRMIKDDHELKIIKSAITRAKRSYNDTIASIEEGISELAVKCRLESAMRNNGCLKESFDTIVVSGRNSALIHGRPSSRKIRRGELILIDYGVRYKNYCTDTTRTVMLGEPNKKQRAVFEIVKEAKSLAISCLKDGVSAKHIDSVARDFITKSGYGDNFLHGLGHGIGIQVHEPPRFSPTEDFTLRAGMLVTVEPGIYLENFGGIRIEDMVYITKTGSKVLTKGSERLIIQGK